MAVATLAAASWRVLCDLGGSSPQTDAKPRRGSSAHWPVILFAIWVGVTYWTAEDRSLAYPWFIEYLKIFVMYAAAVVLVRSLKQAWTLLIVATLSVVLDAPAGLPCDEIYPLEVQRLRRPKSRLHQHQRQLINSSSPYKGVQIGR